MLISLVYLETEYDGIRRKRAVAVRMWKSHGLPIERDSQVFHNIQAKSIIFDGRPPTRGNCTLTLENRRKEDFDAYPSGTRLRRTHQGRPLQVFYE